MEQSFVEKQWEEGNDLYVRLTVAQAHIRNSRVIAFVPLHGDEIKIQLYQHGCLDEPVIMVRNLYPIPSRTRPSNLSALMVRSSNPLSATNLSKTHITARRHIKTITHGRMLT